MKQLLDFLPLIVFFTVYKFYDIFTATKALILTTAIVLIFCWIKYRKVEKMTIITFIMVALFGSLTIYFDDVRFIIWKVTTINVLFALALLITPFFIKQTLLQRMLGKELELPSHVWWRLNLIWIAFFIIGALVNLYIGFMMTLDAWTAFKSFILPCASLFVTLGCGVYVYRYLPKQQINSDK